jgi:SAM-dependent methyltransferase
MPASPSLAPGPATACPICTSASIFPIFERRDVPVLLNRLYDSTAAARGAATGRLWIVACRSCGFVFNAAFDPSLIDYDSRYENDQGNSPAFSTHLDIMADRILARLGGRTDVGVVEIGCGQARFLATLVERSGGRISAAVGYDPAWRGEASLPHVRVEARNFDAPALRCLAHPIDVVLSRHVIEHLADPVGFLSDIRNALPSSWDGELFLETPSLEWIANRHVLHDFFHEHCNYFSSAALGHALARAGFHARRIEPVFDGQYHWAESVAGRPQAPLSTLSPGPASLEALAAYERDFTASWQTTLASLKPKGNIAIWGAGAKGVTFANMIDPRSEWITCLIDINPAKQNRFAPVTAHPVRHPREALRDGVASIIIMNPNYRTEIEAALVHAGEHPELLEA